MVPVTYTFSPPRSHSSLVGTVGLVLSTRSSSVSSSSSVEVLLKLDERLVSAVKVSASSSGTPMSVGAMIGDPGVWTSSSIGRGRRGGLVRYETSCRLLICMAALSNASDLSDTGDRTDDLGEQDEAW